MQGRDGLMSTASDSPICRNALLPNNSQYLFKICVLGDFFLQVSWDCTLETTQVYNSDSSTAIVCERTALLR